MKGLILVILLTNGYGVRHNCSSSVATHFVEDLNRIRSKKSWQEIPGYDRVAAQLRMIVDEFLYENASRKENDRVNPVIL